MRERGVATKRYSDRERMQWRCSYGCSRKQSAYGMFVGAGKLVLVSGRTAA